MNIQIPTFSILDKERIHLLPPATLIELRDICNKALADPVSPLPQNIKTLSIKALDLMRRTQNVLIAYDLYTVGALAGKTETDLMNMRNFGHICLRDVKDALEKINVKLRA